MEEPLYVTAEDAAHVYRVKKEVEKWCNHYKQKQNIIPDYLLIAYTKHMIELSKRMFVLSHESAPKYKHAISDTLVLIEETVMHPDFPNMEMRMGIIRLYHDAGYSTAGQYQMRL